MHRRALRLARHGEDAMACRTAVTRWLLDSDPSIRIVVDRESTLLAEADHDFIDRLIFWQEQEPPGVVVDPVAESKRIRESLAMGEAPTKGETPVIKRRKKGWLEGIF
jgi:hypothetical protein